MADNGLGGGRRPPNRGRGRGGGGGRARTTNSHASTLHISTSESVFPSIGQDPLPTSHESSVPTSAEDPVCATPARQATPSTPKDSLTPQYTSPSIESGGSSDQRVWLSLRGTKFCPVKGPSDVISQIFRKKFEGSWPTWKSVDEKVQDMWFREFKKSYKWDPQHEHAIRNTFERKGSNLMKNAMNKIHHGQDKGTWIPASHRVILDQYWSSTDFKNKSSTAKANWAIERGASAYTGGSISAAAHYEKLAGQLKRSPTAWELVEKTKKLKNGDWVNDKIRDIAERYQQRLEEVQQTATEEGTSAEGSSASTSTAVTENEAYLQVVGFKNKKGNVYGLGGMGNEIIRSVHAQPTMTQVSPVTAEVIEEMRETIKKLNAEILTKTYKEKTFEEQMARMREEMQHIVQHLQIQPLRPVPTPPTPTFDDHGHNTDDELDDLL